MKVIIDTDPGTDDALALMMALNAPELDIRGITTVGGNATLAHTTRNALRLLEHLERTDIPVYRGSARPLRGKFRYAYHFHGPGGLTVKLPRPKSLPMTLGAPEYIVRQAHSLRGRLVLIALGPLTNIARAFIKEPRVKGWIREILVMGGAVEVPGNVTPHAEFNIYGDPGAADIVFSSGVSVTLIGLDVCDRVYIGREDSAWFSVRSGIDRLAARILANWFASRDSDDRYSLCDPLTIVAALRPDLLAFRQSTVSVETNDGERRGLTTATYEGGNVRVASAVRADETKELIKSLLADRTL